MLSLATDHITSTGCPEPTLRSLAAAGFSHCHWCFQWNTDFLYADAETDAIRGWLDELGLAVLDVHGSAGAEKGWCSAVEYERLAGVELVKNRIDFAARLGAGVIVMHVPPEPEDEPGRGLYWARLARTFDALQPFARDRGVRIALENLAYGNFGIIERLFELYPADFLGLCYDSGHGNMTGDGLDQLDGLKDRLLAVHLHDNDGKDDLHLRPFLGTTDWERLTSLLAASAYEGPISMEVSLRRHEGEEEAEFLAHCVAAGTRLAQRVASHHLGGLTWRAP